MRQYNDYIDLVEDFLSIKGLDEVHSRQIVNESIHINKEDILLSLIQILSRSQVKKILENALYITAEGMAELYPSCGDTNCLEALFQGRYDLISHYSKPRGEENNICYYKFAPCKKIMDRSFADLSKPLYEGSEGIDFCILGNGAE